MSDSTADVTELTWQEQTMLETFCRAFQGEPNPLDQLVTPDWQDVPLEPGQQPGRDGAKPVIRTFANAFPDIKIVIHEIMGGAGRAGGARRDHRHAHRRVVRRGAERPKLPDAAAWVPLFREWPAHPHPAAASTWRIG